MVSLGRYTSNTAHAGNKPLYVPHNSLDLRSGMNEFEWNDEEFPVIVEDDLFDHPEKFRKGLHFSNNSSSAVNYFIYRAAVDKNGTWIKASDVSVDNFQLPGGSAFSYPIPPTGYILSIYGPLLSWRQQAGRSAPYVLWQGFQMASLKDKVITFNIDEDKPDRPQINVTPHKTAAATGAWGKFVNDSSFELKVIMTRPHSITSEELSSYNSSKFIPDSGGKIILSSSVEALGSWIFHIPIRHWFVEACEDKAEQEALTERLWTDPSSQTEGQIFNRVVLDSTFANRGDIIVTLNGDGGGSNTALVLRVTNANKSTVISTRMVLNRSGIIHYDPDMAANAA